MVIPQPTVPYSGEVRAREDDFDDDPRFYIGTDARFPDLVCGECGTVLATGTEVKDVVLQCGHCRAFNQA